MITLELAAAEALRTILSNNLSVLNATMVADTLLPANLAQALIPVVDDDVQVGDLLLPWDSKANSPIMKIRVSPGHYRTGTITSVTKSFVEMSPTAGYKNMLYNDVVCYLAPDIFFIEKTDLQARVRLRMQLVVAGWLRRTLNAYDKQEVSIASTEHVTTAADSLSFCMATNISRGVLPLGYGDTQFTYGVTATYTSQIE